MHRGREDSLKKPKYPSPGSLLAKFVSSVVTQFPSRKITYFHITSPGNNALYHLLCHFK